MRQVGKVSSIIILIVVFIVGVAIMFFFNDRMDDYLKLCGFVVWPLMLLMGGVATTGVVKALKGESTIDEITK